MDMEMELLTPNDGDLEAWVALARRRDQIGQRAFEHLFWYYQGAIGTYLAHLVQHEEIARDLAQDTFVAAWQALPQFTGETHFRAWLYRIATNKAYTYLHRQRRQPISLEALLEQEEGGAEALLAQGGQWEDQLVTSELISQVLATLSPRSRTCLLLQDAVGCSQREIAQILGISEQTVAAYVSRARESFRQRYRQMEAAVQAPGGQAHSTPD